jgi:hypothetical protein
MNAPTPIADMVERMLAEGAPAVAIVAAVRAFENVTLRHASSRDASRSVTQEHSRLRSKRYRNRKKSQQVAKANDVAATDETVTVHAVTHHSTPTVGTNDSLLFKNLSVMKKEESKKEVVTRARGTRLKSGETVTRAFIEAAEALGAQRARIPAMWDEFVDYWSAVPGSRGCKLDWLATWRNRVRQIVSKGNFNGKAKDNPRAGSINAALHRRIREAEGEGEEDAN